MPTLPFIQEVNQILIHGDCQDSETRFSRMIALAFKHQNRDDLDALDREILQLFIGKGLGAGEDETSRNHHTLYAFVSGFSLLRRWGQQPAEGRPRGLHMVCLYCGHQFTYAVKGKTIAETVAGHLHKFHRTESAILPIVQQYMAFGSFNIQELRTAEFLSLQFSTSAQMDSSGIRTGEPLTTAMSGSPSANTRHSAVTNPPGGHGYEQDRGSTAHLSSADSLLIG